MSSSISTLWRIMCISAVITALLSVSSQASYVQPADLDGWAIPSYSKPLVVSDDWVSPFTGVVTEMNFWLAWKGDVEGDTYTPAILYISTDNDLGSMHVPGDIAWISYYSGDTQRDLPAGTVDQGWYSPAFPGHGMPEEVAPHDHAQLRQLSVTNLVDAPTVQAGQRYWITMYIHATSGGSIGWSTSASQTGMPATYDDPDDGQWKQLSDPLTGEPLDMAFEIIPEPSTLLLGVLGGWFIMRRNRRS
jgi:hypothetical protein